MECGFGHRTGTLEAQEFSPAAIEQFQAESLALVLAVVLAVVRWEVQRVVGLGLEVELSYLHLAAEVRNLVAARTGLGVVDPVDSLEALAEPVARQTVPLVPVHNGCWVAEQTVERCRARVPVVFVLVVG